MNDELHDRVLIRDEADGYVEPRCVFDCFIPGPPPTKERARTVKNTKTGRSKTFTPTKTRNWEQAATAHFRIRAKTNLRLEDAPYILDAVAVFGRPKGATWPPGERRPCTLEPDADNIVKTVMDALAPSRSARKVAWMTLLSNDKLLWSVRIRKVYGHLDEDEGVHLRLYATKDDFDVVF